MVNVLDMELSYRATVSKGFRVNLFEKVVIIRDYGQQMCKG